MRLRLRSRSLTWDDHDEVSDQAAEWVLRVSEDSSLEAECAEWRAADPKRQAAWAAALGTWSQAGHLGTLARADWDAEIAALTRRTRRFPGGARWGKFALAASLAAVAFLGWRATLPDAEFGTAVAQNRDVTLADGSRVSIGGQSDVELHFDKYERRAVLRNGQAFFAVAHDADRPFTVVAGNAEVRVTGTRFDVRRHEDAVTVSVLEGRVEVRHRPLLPLLGGDRPKVILTAGLSASLAPRADKFSSPRREEIAAGSWRNGRFFYHEAPLSEIVADAQRYNHSPIRLADPTVGALRVTTSFDVARVEGFLENLQTILPVRKVREADGTITLESTSNAQ